MSDNPHIYYGRDRPALKEWGGRLPVALVFAQPSKVALSTLGWQVVWKLLNDCPEIAVERFFWEGGDEPPVAYDSGRELSEFPVIAFSLNFEEEIKGLVEVLGRAGVPARRDDRNGWPLVLAGGPLAFLNPAPVAPAIDLFWVGEAEAGFDTLLVDLASHVLDGGEPGDFVAAVAQRVGVYAPGLTSGTVRRALPENANRTLPEPGHSCFVSPESEFRDMFLLEVNRGCPYGCRFCAAGYIYRPPRHADMATLQAKVEAANPLKVGLVGTALTDWPELLPFLKWLHERGTKFSLASLRADGLSEELLEFLRRTGTRSLTLALEGASRRLRTAVNKRLDEEAFLDAVRRASRLQFNHLKMYLIAGWPGEGPADYEELGEFLKLVAEAIDEGRGGKKKGIDHVTVSASCLVPKPWTPFQWAPMATEKQLSSAMQQIRAVVKPLKGFRAMVEKPSSARLQALLARGGEEIFDLAEAAARPGMSWKKALKQWDVDPAQILDRERDENEVFPWECLEMGVDRKFLWREWQRYKKEQASRHCGDAPCEACNLCGMGKWLQPAK
ncbi:radical SAM protein [Desulfovibrio ferrophilus]|uniref:Fe-S oxidoreductase n=1 Tax=Desulfovibrio ferrophilus TaxID=241368 RepID=A0A2Z6AZ42_9BACT|nr:radical SAM protein [Desulfovibrio ferrophilus]BBD08537.1 Fe-S oxidoreductase [Desulfovibrio ferrophilus]